MMCWWFRRVQTLHRFCIVNGPIFWLQRRDWSTQGKVLWYGLISYNTVIICSECALCYIRRLWYCGDWGGEQEEMMVRSLFQPPALTKCGNAVNGAMHESWETHHYKSWKSIALLCELHLGILQGIENKVAYSALLLHMCAERQTSYHAIYTSSEYRSSRTLH